MLSQTFVRSGLEHLCLMRIYALRHMSLMFMREIRNKNTENVTLLKQKKKSLSLNRKSVKYSYDDLQNMFLQEEQKVMDIVKVSKKISSELQQGSDGNSTPPSEAEHEEVSEEWTYL